MKGKKKRFIISINQSIGFFRDTPLLMFPCSDPRGPIYRHIGHIRSIQKQIKVFFIRLHLKNNGDAWSCSATATTASWSRDRKRSHKSPYDLVNIKKIISATESESEQSEHFHFLQRKRQYILLHKVHTKLYRLLYVKGRVTNLQLSRSALEVSVEVSIKRQSVTACG